MKITKLNVSALAHVANGRREFSNRLEAVDYPHVKRCLAMGLVEADPPLLRLTAMGVRAINELSEQTSGRYVRIPEADKLESPGNGGAEMDASFVDMVRGALETLAEHGIDPQYVSSWDDVSNEPEDDPLPAVAGHAVGFIAGCAAALDVTPLEFLDNLPKEKPCRK